MKRFAMTALLLTTFACAAGSGSSSSTSTSPSASRRTDVITEEELRADPAVATGDALTAVRRLRPAFLATRGTASSSDRTAGQAMVSIDGGPLQTLDNLSRYMVSVITEIRYLNPNEAAQRYGTASRGGCWITVFAGATVFATWSAFCPRTTTVSAGASGSSASSTWRIIGRPATSCSIFGRADFIRLPSPAARTMAAKELFIGGSLPHKRNHAAGLHGSRRLPTHRLLRNMTAAGPCSPLR